MPLEKSITHVIPGVGLWKTSLYPPAGLLYARLIQAKEERRLIQLRHLGALTHALPGTRQARWDYTVAMVYYADQLKPLGMNSRFRLGKQEFSSMQSALQSIALIWNIGHLPGTYSVAKGVYRFLSERNSKYPACLLEWPYADSPQVKRFKQESNRLLLENDYVALARVLAVIKLLSLAPRTDDFLFQFTNDFAAPFLLEYENDNSKQWDKIRTAFKIVRHLAYLTLDTPLSGLQWAPHLPSLLQDQIAKTKGLEELADNICELLSPLERMVFSSLYYLPAARKEASVVAELVARRLGEELNPEQILKHWLTKSLFRDLRIRQKQWYTAFDIAASVRLRSHFSIPQDSPVKMERSLTAKGFSHPIVLEYKAWNSAAMIEPDELLVDVMTNRIPTPDDVGRMIAWVCTHFDDHDASIDDSFYALRRGELEPVYLSLLRRAVELAYPGIGVRFEPWPLHRFLVPGKRSLLRGGIWGSSSKLNDKVIRQIFRRRAGKVAPEVKDNFVELLGLSELRNVLRRQTKRIMLRQCWLVVTGSVRFCRDSKDLIEYDGGLLKVSSRSGKLVWFGLETKNGRTDPLYSLNKRLRVLGITARTHRLSSCHAYVELPLVAHGYATRNPRRVH